VSRKTSKLKVGSLDGSQRVLDCRQVSACCEKFVGGNSEHTGLLHAVLHGCCGLKCVEHIMMLL
jgi:hypothetical protein